MIRPPHLLLVLHDIEGFLGAQERARQDRVDDGLPAIEGELLDRSAGTKAGIVEQHVAHRQDCFAALAMTAGLAASLRQPVKAQ